MLTNQRPLRGRSRELCLLDEVARRTARGESILAHMVGQAGVGKTALVDTWLERLAATDVRTQRILVTPLATMASASIVQPVLQLARSRSSDEQLWKTSLERDFPDGHHDLAISLRTGATKDAQIAELRHSLLRLLVGEQTSYAPAIIVFEDIHWADVSVRHLISDIAAIDSPALSMVLTYRPGVGEPTRSESRNMREKWIHIPTLDRHHLTRLAQDQLGKELAEPGLIEHLVHTSKGVPLTAVHTLNEFERTGSLADAERVGDVDSPVSWIFADVLDQLSPDALRFLQVAALLDGSFDEHTISACLQWSDERVTNAATNARASTAVWQGSDAELTFSHDELRDAALFSLGEERSEIARSSGLNLARTGGAPAIAVARLLLHVDSWLDDAEAGVAKKAWLDAGQEALNRGSFDFAHDFVTAAWQLTRAQDAIDHAAMRTISETGWLMGNAELTSGVLALAAGLQVDRTTSTDLAYFHMRALAANAEFDHAIDVALDQLRSIGITFPASPKQAHVVVPYLRIVRMLSKFDPEDLVNLPPAGPEESSIQRLIAGLVGLVYAERPQLFPLVVLEGARRLKTQGVSSFAPVSIVGFAALAAMSGKHQLAKTWGQAAMALADQPGFEQSRSWTAMQYYDFVHHWHEPAHAALEPLTIAFEDALRSADLHTAGLVANVWTGTAFITGAPLHQIDDRISQVLPSLEGHHLVTRVSELTQQLVQTLMGTRSHYEADAGQSSDQLITSVDQICDHAAAFFASDPVEALEKAELAATVLAGVRGTSNVAGFRLVYALTLAQADDDPQRLKRTLKKAIRDFRKWAKLAPFNYEPGLLLLEAELARLSKNLSRALDLYQASASMSENHVNQAMTAALAKTRAGDLEFQAGRYDAARGWFNAAERSWQRVGAFGVIAQMRDRYVFPDDRSNDASAVARAVEANRPLLTHALVTMLDVLSADNASIVETSEDIEIIWLDAHQNARNDIAVQIAEASLGDSQLVLRVEGQPELAMSSEDLSTTTGFSTLTSILAPTHALATRPVTHVTVEGFVRQLFAADAERVLRGGVAENDLTVLSIDIVNYTGRIETMAAADGVIFLNRYLDAMIQPILEQHGLPEPREGDAIMAMFLNAEDAVRAALQLPDALAEFNRQFMDSNPVSYRAGIASGPVGIGVVEPGGRPSLSQVGDALNLAARLGNAATQLGCQLLVDGSTVELLTSSDFTVTTEPVFSVTNRAEAVHCYRVEWADQAADNEASNLSSLCRDIDAAIAPIRQLSKHAAAATAP